MDSFGVMKVLLYCAVVIFTCVGARRRYDGYSVLEIVSESENGISILKNWLAEGEVELWQGPMAVGRPVQVLVSPEFKPEVISVMQCHAEVDTVEEDIQIGLDKLWERIDSRAEKVYDPNDFNTLGDIYIELNRLNATECPPGFSCELFPFGVSVEGRPLLMMKVSGGPDRPAVYLDSLIHSGEWLAGTTLMRIIDRLITQYGEDDEATYLMDTYDWILIPVVNPDGYVYTFEEVRSWRKNRAIIDPDSGCVGVDLNRNFDAFWGEPGASDDPCSGTFRGPSAASEPEIQAVQQVIIEESARIIALVTIHTAGQYWLLPWGVGDEDGNCLYPDDYDDLLAVGQAAADAVEETHGTEWSVGSACDQLYLASGNTMDFGKLVGDIKYTSALELRSPASPENIEPSFLEIWNGIQAMLEAIAEKS